MTKKAPKIFILAGESSGDFLGGSLLKALKKQNPDATFFGVGGPLMAEAGLTTSLVPMNDLTLLGFTEVIPKIPLILKHLKTLEKAIIEEKPDVIITIDVPGFSKRLIKRIKPLNIPCFHYVAPTVWAYREGRAKTWSKLGAHMLTLFAFEPPYFEKLGSKATFVGHPLIESPKAYQKPQNDDNFYVLVMPGSRQNEITRHAPIFKKALTEIYQSHPNMVVLMPTFERFEPALKGFFERAPFQCIIADQSQKDAFFGKAHIALAASGTATLELALAKIPMVIAYKLNLLTAFIAWCFLRTKHVGLANILAKNPSVPELLQHRCTTHNLTVELLNLINNEKARKTQLESFESILPQIKHPEGLPSEIAAKTILQNLN